MQDQVLSVFGLKGIARYPLGYFGLSSKLIFYSECNRDKLLASDPLNLRARSLITNPPTTLPVHNITDRLAVRVTIGVTDNAFLIGYFGLLYRGKGIEWLLEAVSMLRAQALHLNLLIIGPHGGVTSDLKWLSKCQDYEQRLKKKATQLDLNDAVIWAGYLDDYTTVQYLSSCDIVCLPFEHGLDNRRSSFTTCALIGLPIVTTRSKDTDRFLLGKETGICFSKPRDPQELAQCIYRLYHDEAFRTNSARKLKKFAARHYRNDKLVDVFDPAAP
jgi:glycosyltransferase involved in cell wall biosynthesis